MEKENLRFCTFVPENIMSTTNNKLRALFAKDKKWENGSTITYSFLNKPSDVIPKGMEDKFLSNLKLLEEDANKKYNEKGIYLKFPLDPLEYKIRDEIKKKGIDIIPKKIKEIVEMRFNPILNLTFNNVKRDDKNPADIRIKFAWNEGCNTHYGKDAKNVENPKEQTMKYSWFDVSTILHEFGHALGLLHEHQSPFGNKILWDVEKVYKWVEKTQGWDKSKVDRQILLRYGNKVYDDKNYSYFDPDSVMLYTYPAEFTLDNKGSIGGPRLSSKDVEHLIKAYPPTEDQYTNLKKLKKNDFLERIYSDLYKPSKENFIFDKKYNNIYYYIFLIIIFLIIIFLIIIFLVFLIFLIFLYLKKNKF